MNESTYTGKTLYYKKAIITLSLISLIFLVATYTNSFITFIHYGTFFHVPSLLERLLLQLLLDAASCSLLLIYALKFYKFFKAQIIVPIICALLTISSLLGVRFDYFEGYLLLITAVMFAIATYALLTGTNKKILILLAPIVGLISEIIFYVLRSASLIGILTPILLYTALILLVIKNKFPTFLSISKNEDSNTETDLEKKLRKLQQKFECGFISEEEYQAQRTEIIRNS